ncbi:GNAT family N-acetyltransferase [Actinotalea sp. K2]|uniref:GNAT family N-acetyltransferase n=1 Tax=Actinotalea sp. K2 TaxID=2939438 RepID=UPI002017E5D7|nr:GNAT family N-acetyltransferase [Actinotalea sp. K2]MCL3862894.1 N-acetyltransferase family protein [Actinotalea sp. K2]
MSAQPVQIRPLTRADWPRVAAIYAEGIATGDATFESHVPSWETWDADHAPGHRWVATDDSASVTGWAACSPVSGRCVYAGVVEVSVYVAEAARGRGVGSALLAAVVASTEVDGVWTLQAGVFAENTGSLALHARHGFRTVGVRERLGQRDGRWRDVVLLERRSTTV